MREFLGKLAVVTGAGTGMGRELSRQLAAEGANLALCDVSMDSMAETAAACASAGGDAVRVSTHRCDVSDEAQVVAFRDAVAREHATDHIHLLFNNAGIAGGGSFVTGNRAEWDKTFAVCWSGVYFCTRAFLPMLVAGPGGVLVNTSSVNGFWASLGPTTSHTAYSAAKFAVKGFTEALMTDCRIHAPHVKVALVMPGHVGTSITHNSRAVLGKPPLDEMAGDDLREVREQMERMGFPSDGLSDDQLRQAIRQRMDAFRDQAPLSAAEAATVILDGVRQGRWRILVGRDAERLDRLVREEPDAAYEPTFMQRLTADGHFRF